MAKGGNKRAATSAPSDEPEGKRVADFLRRQDVTLESYRRVLDVLQHPLSGLSDSQRAMILAVLPWSIAVPADERHEVQKAAVSMVDEIAEAVQAELQRAVDVEKERIDELQATRAELDSAVNQSEATKTEARCAVEERMAELAEADATVLQKKALHRESDFEEKRLTAELEQKLAQKAALEDALSIGFAKLKDGSCQECEVEALVAAVVATAKTSSLEDSLVMALTSSLAKRERGAFDEAVINEAEQGFRGKIAALGEVVGAAKELLATQAAAVQTSQAELETASADQAQAAEGLRIAQEASSTAAAAAQSAKDAVGELDAKLAAPTAAMSQKSMELQQFCENILCMFKFLRDRVSKQSEEPAQEPVEVARKESAGERDADAAAPLAGA